MPTIRLETWIDAPIERCFDLARHVQTHCATVARTRERAVAGVTTGHLGMGDRVTWEAVHFGLRQRLTVIITEFDRPYCFVDKMVSGPFRSMEHRHEFAPTDGGTLVTDLLQYASPLGSLGVIADRLFLERYLRRLLSERNAALKEMAEEQSR